MFISGRQVPLAIRPSQSIQGSIPYIYHLIPGSSHIALDQSDDITWKAPHLQDQTSSRHQSRTEIFGEYRWY